MWRFLRTLFGATPPGPKRVHKPPAEFGQAAAPDWLLEWKGAVLPHGGSFRGRLLLREGVPPLAQVEYPVSRTRPAPPREVPLSTTAETRLRLVLLEAFPERLLSVEEGCRDGIPIAVVVHRQEPHQGVRAWCNLCDALGLIEQGHSSQARSFAELIDRAFEPGRTLAPVYRLGLVLFEASIVDSQENHT